MLIGNPSNPLIAYISKDEPGDAVAWKWPRFAKALVFLMTPTDSTDSDLPPAPLCQWRPLDCAGTLKTVFWIGLAIGLVMIVAAIAR